MSDTITPILKEINNKQFSTVYFLHGEEPYYIDKISDLIEKKCLPEHEKSFNQTIIYGKDTSMSSVIQRARQFPMMADRAVVIVKEAQEISDFDKEEGAKLLDAYLQNPLPSTVLVFCYKNKKLDARKAISKSIAKHSKLIYSEKIKDYKLNEWINNYIQSRNLKTTPSACQLLAECLGNDLRKIESEIDKIEINIDGKTIIDEKIIEKHVGISKEFNVFELQKSLLMKDALKSYRIVQYFASNPKANPLPPILINLFNFFNKILIVSTEEDKSESNIAKVLGVNPFFVKDYLTGANKFSIAKLIEIISCMRDTDLKSKGVDSGEISEYGLLKELVFKIIH